MPLVLTVVRPEEKSVTHRYLVAISTDDGKTWKFVDGTNEYPDLLKEDCIPDLPASVKLPEHEDPVLTDS